MAWYDPFINYITGTGSGSLLGDIKDNAGNIALGTAGLGLLSNAYSRLGDIGDESQAGANIIAQQGLQQSQFRPFTVTSTTGSQFGFTPAGIPLMLHLMHLLLCFLLQMAVEAVVGTLLRVVVALLLQRELNLICLLYTSPSPRDS